MKEIDCLRLYDNAYLYDAQHKNYNADFAFYHRMAAKYGDYDESPFNTTSRKQILLCKKR